MIPWPLELPGLCLFAAAAELLRGRFGAFVALLALAACGGGEVPPIRDGGSAIAGRVITLDLWAGDAGPGAVALPRIDRTTPAGVRIRGPVDAANPAGGGTVPAYERVVERTEGRRRQVLTITQGGAGLGRIQDVATGVPERQFSGDIVFPLGLWFPGEARQFEATELTLFGPADRLVTVEIVDLDFVHAGVANSFSYGLTMRDAAGRVLDCEFSIYSPGVGLAHFESGGQWSDRGCPG